VDWVQSNRRILIKVFQFYQNVVWTSCSEYDLIFSFLLKF
jgi:hypothetical protein